MSKKGGDLKRLIDKRISLRLNGNREVSGVLRGYDQFMNLVLDKIREESGPQTGKEGAMGVVRGNSIILIQPMEAVE